MTGSSSLPLTRISLTCPLCKLLRIQELSQTRQNGRNICSLSEVDFFNFIDIKFTKLPD